MNIRRPPRLEYIGHSELREQVTHRRGVNDIGVQQRRQDQQWL
jgi:hypothetical protein